MRNVAILTNPDHRPALGLALVVVIYLGLAWFYNIAIPFGKGPDELTHYHYALFISAHGRLPMTQTERAMTGTRAYLPPLYHVPVGFLMAMTRQSYPTPLAPASDDLWPPLKVSWEPSTRQLIDIVLSRTTLIRTEDERAPFWGEYLAWATGRLVSIVLNAGTIILTFFIGCLLWPERPWFALLGAALVAFNPMVLFISAVLNDDNMVGLTMAAYLLLLVWFLKDGDSGWLYLGMGLLIGLAITTKYNTGLAALGMAVMTGLVHSRRGWTRGGLARRVALVWLAALVGSGWWFIWTEVHFNEIAEYGLVAGALKPFAPDVDPTAHRLVSFFSDSLSDPGLPTNGIRGNIWDWLRRTFETTWALTVFGVEPYPLYWPLMIVLAGLVGLSSLGLCFAFRQSDTFKRTWIIAFLIHFILVFPLPLIRFFLTNRINDSAQGRHIFYPAAPAIMFLLLAGWDYWIKPAHKRSIGLLGLGALLVWAIFHGWHLWLAYPPALPIRTTPGPQMELAHSTQANFEDVMLLTGYQTQVTNDSSLLQIDLGWQSLAQANEDYATEITLVDPRGQAQRRWISHPAQGRFPVRAWQPGDLVRDTIQLPLAGLSPGEYDVQLRLLGWDEPLPSNRGERLTLTTLSLETSPQSAEVVIWQQDEAITEKSESWLALLDATGPPVYRYRSTIPVTLPEAVEVSLTGPDGQLRQPVTDVGQLHTFLVDYDWPSGSYVLQAAGQTPALTFQVANFDSRPQRWNFTPPEMMIPVQANFGDQVELLGYDLPLRRVEAGAGIPLVLYWQGLTQMREDYTISVQLLDADLQRQGGYDRFPRETYNTYLWVPGEIVDDGFAVPVEPDAPAGVYTIRVGLYWQHADQVEVLPLVQDGQPLSESSVAIDPIKVGGPPPEVVLLTETFISDRPAALIPAGGSFGEPPVILLHGYELNRQAEALHLTLYWESLAQTPVDWSIFVHIRDQSGQIIAQRDGPAGHGLYPTSLWDPGEVIADEVIVPLPANMPNDPYSVIVGLYDLKTGQRLVVPASNGDEIILTQQELSQ